MTGDEKLEAASFSKNNLVKMVSIETDLDLAKADCATRRKETERKMA